VPFLKSNKPSPSPPFTSKPLSVRITPSPPKTLPKEKSSRKCSKQDYDKQGNDCAKSREGEKNSKLEKNRSSTPLQGEPHDEIFSLLLETRRRICECRNNAPYDDPWVVLGPPRGGSLSDMQSAHSTFLPAFLFAVIFHLNIGSPRRSSSPSHLVYIQFDSSGHFRV
jgi:hypothetical protein